ncbi:Putative fluoride ion transporter CrcB [bacterium HR40]|nr:Putative fluoride ion transporter CrcB [bacterium HR40]
MAQALALYFWVGLGSALGGMARYLVSGVVARAIGETFPFGTLAVNVLGSLVIGLFVAVTGPDGRLLVDPSIRQFVTLGLCGGFTTFSSFSLQTLVLLQEGEWWLASLNVLASVIGCLAAVWLGWQLGQGLNRLP